MALAREAVQHLEDGDAPDSAAEQVIALLGERVGGEGGCILVDKRGRVGFAHNSSHMSCAYRTSDLEAPVVTLKKRS